MAEDKQFEASQRKLRKAREKGEVAHSRDFTAAGVLLLVTLAAPALFGGVAVQLLRAGQQALGHLHEFEPSPGALKALAAQWGTVFAGALAPLLVTTMACALVLSFLQTGPLLTTFPLIPQLNRLNPAQAAKRLFSWRGTVETLKSLLRLAAVGLTVYLVLRHRGSQLLTLGHMEPVAAFAFTGRLAWELTLKAALMLLILGAADYAYQRFEHTRSLRMTREEMRQETRETEGDPQTRSKRQRQRRQLLRDGTSRRLPQATVVLTNPTHVAVALYYRPSDMPAPVVVARGRGHLAERIKGLARRHGIPVQENPPLARALYRACPLGAQIPANLYRTVAVILAELHRQAALRRQRLRQSRP